MRRGRSHLLLLMVAAMAVALAATSRLHADEPSIIRLAWPGEARLEPATPVVRRDGTAVFPLELYSLKRDEDYRIARNLGFNAVIDHHPDTADLARRHGFSVTQANWLFAANSATDITNAVARGAGDPALIAHNLNDEPDLRSHAAPPEAMVAIADQVHALDPGSHTSLTLAGNRWSLASWPAYARAADVLRVDPYPLVAGRPLRQVSDHVLAARAAGPGKPVICILQAWTWGGQPLPSPAQQYQMACQALVAGANGLSWFDWNDEDWQAPFAVAVSEVNRLIATELRDFLVTGRALPRLEMDEVAARLWADASGDWRILVVDLRDPQHDAEDDDSPRTVRVDLPSGVALPSAFRLNVVGDAGPARRIDGRDGGLEFELPRGAAVLIAPDVSPVTANPAAVADRARPYFVDFAGRPLSPYTLSPGDGLPELPAAGDRQIAVAAAGRTGNGFELARRIVGPFAEAGGDFHVESTDIARAIALGRNDPAAPIGVATTRFRVFAGGRVVLPLHFSMDGARALGLQLVSWHDTVRLHTGVDLAALATLEVEAPSRSTSRLGPLVRNLVVHLPNDQEWAGNRDHLLTVRLHYRLKGRDYQEERVLRFRVQRAFSADVAWTPPPAGDVGSSATARFLQIVVRPTFPLACYASPDLATWHLRLPSDRLAAVAVTTVAAVPPETPETPAPPPPPGPPALRVTYRLTPFSRLSAERFAPLTPLVATVRVAETDFNVGLQAIRLTRSGIVARASRELLAPALPVALNVEPPSNDESWMDFDHVTRAIEAAVPLAVNTPPAPDDGETLAPPITAWANFGDASLADVDHRAWFAWDARALYLFVDLQGSHDGVRAEVTDASVGGMRADDVLTVLLHPGADGEAPLFVLDLNPAGVARPRRFDVLPAQTPQPWALSVPPRCHIDSSANRWQVYLTLPWSDLGLTAPPADGVVSLNLFSARRTAPREFYSLAPLADENASPASARLHLLPAATP